MPSITELHELSEDLLEDAPANQWVEDYLPGCSRRTLPLGEDFEGPVSATLVRLESEGPSGKPREAPGAPVLQIHGWTDYFYNLPMATEWARAGHRFYALDLRKYGRSLREGQSPGHIEDLEEYDQEITAALRVLRQENPEAPVPIIHGHSTGGLIAALYAHRHPRDVGALVLNSPWLEVPGDVPARTAAEGLVAPVKALNPKATLKVPRLDNYWESLSDQAHGEWTLHPRWRPRQPFPMTVGWLKAVFAGHRQVHRGLDLPMPILVLLSSGTVYRRHWTQEYQENDGVLDVDLLARRAVKLGRCVTVLRVPRAMHDVFASEETVRMGAFAETVRWLRAYGPDTE
ncbi:alpha/beta hydrolase [Nesterenkonia flava]|uniref:Alpha/beta hydrolase n=1 Tax=Nesterenkonia flava TaxID=469799 RepID=A0ABU1FPT6_9MICC|nr:alpha/beta hydrolase [Nesterenkonia flava]MDR5710656.1 alpha/beta hydrolase [Nesterenkonia flava]